MRFCAIIVLFAYFQVGFTQNCDSILLGELKDFHDNTPIVGATLFIKNLNKYVTSDENGKFKIENLCKGEITLVISHIACETKTVTYNIDGDVFKSVFLEHHLEQLNEVVVSANTKIDNTSIQRSLKKETIDDFSDKSLGDALNTISGVSSLNTGNTIVKPMIHGLHSSRLLIINNNVRLFDQEWGDEHAPNIDINAAGRIDVIKGANTLMYGSDAIGGLILIRSQNYAAKDSIFGTTSLSLNTNGWGGNINSEIVRTYENGLYGKLQASYRKFGDFESPEYQLSNTGLRSVNASARIGYKSFEKGFEAYYSFVDNEFGILRASHIGNVNDLVRAINSGEPQVIDDFSYDIDNPRQSILHHLGKVEAYKRFKGLGKLSVQYDFQINRRKEFDLRRGNRSNTPVIDLRLFTTSLQSNLKIDAYDNLKLNTGFLLRYQQNNAVSGTGVSPLIPDFDKYDVGAYVTGTYNLDLFTEVSAGFRYDFSRIEAEKRYRLADWNEIYNYDELFPEFESGTIEDSRILTFPEFSFHNFSASLGLTRHFSNDIDLFFNYGLASRMPNPSELFSDGLHHSAARIEIGLLTMQKEVANKFVMSIERNNQNFGFTVSPYYKYINDFIQLIPNGITTTVRGAFPVWEYNQINARIFGIDIDINKKISNFFSYNGSISLLQGDNLSDDIPLINMPATNFTNSITYYNEDLNQLSVGLRQKTVLQQNRYPDYNFFTFDPILQEDVFVDISSTPSAYTLVDFNSSINFKAFKTGNLNIAFNVSNLFNVSYRENLNRLRYFADELGRNFNIKLKLNY
ncbi:TonB-dependent receptor [uncultured Winogradskyella sp.]|uniref:TonB-dependent receptor n=1 Tax=uncultured Winogradskyella sp. TaxID=395353 RepID=UPI0026269565|nr:TonB-dependent receptor [uncultured Winogradskyella sp.]